MSPNILGHWHLRARHALCLILAATLLSAVGCGAGSSTSVTPPGGGTPPPTPPPTVNNTQPIQVNAGPLNNDVNELMTSVTICVPGSNTCQTISDVLVDTGSVGLRLFAPQVSLTLTRLTDGAGNPVGNCAGFVANSYAWGPVVTADVQLAGEVASSVPIQLMNASNFPAVPAACSNGGTNTDVNSLGANGILGVGVFRQDCGSGCTSAGAGLPPIYFGCSNSGCSPEAVSLQQQVQNPVWLFASDNNGLVISLPTIDPSGAPSASGSMVFGIGTQSNNNLNSAQVYTTDLSGNFTVTFSGTRHSGSFLDSGSNGYFFLDATTLGIPKCAVSTDFYCPATTQAYSIITTGTNGTANTFTIDIANADSLFNSANTAFNDVGGPTTGGFDLGVPFFYGRPVFVGIEGQSSSGGTGPYWAY